MKNRNAFTIVELLVVVTLIAVLIAMLLPAVAVSKETTLRLVCASQLRQCAVATTSYAADFAGNFPRTTFHKRIDVGTSGGLVQAQSDRDVNALSLFIDQYLQGSLKTFVCPTDYNVAAARAFRGPLATYRTSANETLIENSSYFWIGGAMTFNSYSITDPRYSSSATVGNIVDPLAPTLSSAPGGYLHQKHIDSAKRTRQWINGAYVVVSGTQSPSKIVLFGDFNDNRVGVNFISHHMAYGMKQAAAVSGNIKYIQGLNEVAADGHVVWTDYDPSGKTTHWFSGGTRVLMVETDR